MLYFILGIIIPSFMLFLSEINRRAKPVLDFKEYYSDPLIILIGCLNTIYKYIDRRIIFDPTNFMIHSLLLNNHDQILNEFMTNYNKFKLTNPGIFSEEFKEKNSDYGYFFVKYYENINSNNFPILSKIISTNDIYTCFFSVINDKKTIPKHRGPYAGIIRYHYTLIGSDINEDFLKVYKHKLYWKNKSAFAFDDTYRHYVNKKSSGFRVSIIIDIKRELPFILNIINTIMLKFITKTEYIQSRIPELNMKFKEKITIFD